MMTRVYHITHCVYHMTRVATTLSPGAWETRWPGKAGRKQQARGRGRTRQDHKEARDEESRERAGICICWAKRRVARILTVRQGLEALWGLPQDNGLLLVLLRLCQVLVDFHHGLEPEANLRVCSVEIHCAAAWRKARVRTARDTSSHAIMCKGPQRSATARPWAQGNEGALTDETLLPENNN